MADYPDILTLEEFVGFLYGMVAGNHDIETIFYRQRAETGKHHS